MTPFKKKRILYQGKYAAIFLAIIQDSSEIVLKEYKKSDLTEEINLLIMNEMQFLSSFHCRNIVRFHRSYSCDEYLWSIFEYCDLGDLNTLIQIVRLKHIRFPENDIIDCAYNVLQGLYYLHKENIVHRNIEPKNILLKSEQSKSVFKINDFTCCYKFLSITDGMNQFIGKPLYMAPEIFQKQYYNVNVDIWSLGCLLYEMCQLEHPFNYLTADLVIKHITEDDIPIISPNYSKELSDLIFAMLTKDPLFRPSSRNLLRYKIFDSRNATYSQVQSKSSSLNSDKIIMINDDIDGNNNNSGKISSEITLSNHRNSNTSSSKVVPSRSSSRTKNNINNANKNNTNNANSLDINSPVNHKNSKIKKKNTIKNGNLESNSSFSSNKRAQSNRQNRREIISKSHNSNKRKHSSRGKTRSISISPFKNKNKTELSGNLSSGHFHTNLSGNTNHTYHSNENNHRIVFNKSRNSKCSLSNSKNSKKKSPRLGEINKNKEIKLINCKSPLDKDNIKDNNDQNKNIHIEVSNDINRELSKHNNNDPTDTSTICITDSIEDSNQNILDLTVIEEDPREFILSPEIARGKTKRNIIGSNSSLLKNTKGTNDLKYIKVGQKLNGSQLYDNNYISGNKNSHLKFIRPFNSVVGVHIPISKKRRSHNERSHKSRSKSNKIRSSSVNKSNLQ